jgi:hypothetical protein
LSVRPLDVQNFKDSESLGEKLWKEVVSDLKTFTNKGCKIATQKKLVFLLIFHCKAWEKPRFPMD